MRRRAAAGLILLLIGTLSARASETTVTVSGVEQQLSSVFDSGSVTVTVNGFPETVTYGKFSTDASVASALAAKFSQDCNSPVRAHANGTGITFQTYDPSAAVSGMAATASWDKTDFASASFGVTIPQTSPVVTPTFTCAPATISLGENLTCTVTLLAGAQSAVSLSVDGQAWTTANPDQNGIATANAQLGQAAGTHTVSYSYPGEATANQGTIPAESGSTQVTVTAAGSAPAGNTVYSFSITDGAGNSGYAPNGNIVNYTDSVNGSWILGYDGLNRLVSSQQSPVAASPLYGCWAYDSFGNMLTQGISNQTFSNALSCGPQSGSTTLQSQASYNASNQVTSGTWLDANKNTHSGTPSYDAAGNITSDLVNTYLYDADGHVCAVQGLSNGQPAGTITGYLYDAEGHRVAKGTLPSLSCDMSNLQVTAEYFIGPDGETMTEIDPSPAGDMWARTEVSAAGQYLATYTPDGIHYPVTDWLGTKRVQVNPNNTISANGVEERCTSQPFGDQQICDISVDASPRHFTGKERDFESGLDYFGARYYGSSMGRFMSPDWTAEPDPVPWAELENPQTLNLYAYVGNNPLSRTDPFGHAQDPCNGNPNCVTVTADEGPDILPLLQAGGHHFVDQSLIRAKGAWNSLSGQFFRRWSTGKLPNPGLHRGYSTPHRLNSAQIRNIIDKVEKEVRKPMSKWDASDIEKAVEEVKSADGDTGAFLAHIAENNPTARTASADTQDVMSAAKSSMDTVKANGQAIAGDAEEAVEECVEGGCPP